MHHQDIVFVPEVITFHFYISVSNICTTVGDTENNHLRSIKSESNLPSGSASPGHICPDCLGNYLTAAVLDLATMRPAVQVFNVKLDFRLEVNGHGMFSESHAHCKNDVEKKEMCTRGRLYRKSCTALTDVC